MQLMTEKRLLVRSERFGSHVYESGIPQEHTQTQIAADLIKRAFNGSSKNLVLGALTAQPASEEDLKEIRRILDMFEGGKAGKRGDSK
jgi:predicted transcriptional regulator